MKYEYDTATPYTASYVIFRQAQKTAFVLRGRGWMKGYYGLPSGKKEWRERPTRAGIREAEEEVGVVVQPEDLKPVLVMHRYESDSEQEWIDSFFEASKWEGEIHNAEPDAHEEVAFFTPSELPENIVPSVRAAIEAIENGEFYIEYGWERDA